MANRSDPPYGAYAAIMGTFVTGLSVTAFLAGRLGRRNAEQRILDLAVLSLATFKAARTFTHDEVTSFIREPFVEGTPAKPDDEQPLHTGGLKQAIGELVTCSRCAGTWVAAGIAGVSTLAPRFGRLLTWSLAIAGANDWLQAGFTALAGAANQADRSG